MENDNQSVYIHNTGRLYMSVFRFHVSLLCARSFSVYCASKVSLSATKTWPFSNIENGASKHHSTKSTLPLWFDWNGNWLFVQDTVATNCLFVYIVVFSMWVPQLCLLLSMFCCKLWLMIFEVDYLGFFSWFFFFFSRSN